MKLKRGYMPVWAAAFLVAALPQLGSAQAAENGKTIWDGVYTAEQADRGERTVRDNCLICHAQTEWTHPMFLNTRAGRPVYDMYEQLRMTMPYDSPGRLTAAEYADVVSFLLKLNEAPPGDQELPADPEGLSAIAVTPPGSR
jgi:S-disulfanyl-L-cysteine oxidoreductase SoxD